jgi:putative serine protease PepD
VTDETDDTEPTQPLSVGPGAPVPPSAPPPPPPGPPPAPVVQPWDDYSARMTQRMPLEPHPHPRHAAGRARIGAWVIPVAAVVALVVGVIGGVLGSVGYDRATGNDTPGSVEDGLAGVDTVELPPLDIDEGTVPAVAEALLPSTVQISATLDGEEGGATGSGFVLDKQGHVITNNHVIESAAEGDDLIEVVDSEGERYEATVVGRSPVYDLAVLYAPDAQDLQPAALGRSKALRVGDGVVAIGSPLGLDSTVTAGIVSALNRPVTTGSTTDEASYINAVQTDAAINPGNSGGPLVNLRGQVVGVNSAIATNGGGTVDGQAGNIGVGFAIPVEQVRVTADQILKDGEARYPVIGAEVQTAGSDEGDGAELRKVLADTPAERAGLEVGDRIIEVDGQRVTDGISLIVSIRTHLPGEKVEFTYIRDGEERTATVELGSEVG